MSAIVALYAERDRLRMRRTVLESLSVLAHRLDQFLELRAAATPSVLALQCLVDRLPLTEGAADLPLTEATTLAELGDVISFPQDRQYTGRLTDVDPEVLRENGELWGCQS